MGTRVRRHVTTAGFVGAALWLIASVAAALDEIEYQDATQASPLPEWVFPVATVIGAASIAMFAQFSGKPGARAARLAILIGAAISLVPLWPFIVIGPFLVAVGFFGAAVAAWINGHRTAGTTLHAFGLPLSIPLGTRALEALGMDPEYGVVVFMTVLALGIVLRAIEPDEEPKAISAPEEAIA